MAHGERPRADEAFPASPQPRALNRTARRVGAVEYPHGLAELRGRFQNVAQRSDEGVDPATHVLQIDQQDVDAIEHPGGRAANLSVQTVHRDAVNRIDEVRRLDHVVLLVPAQAVLGTERRDDVQVAERRERVQGMREIPRDRCRVREEPEPLAPKRLAQCRFLQEAVYPELHADGGAVPQSAAASSRA